MYRGFWCIVVFMYTTSMISELFRVIGPIAAEFCLAWGPGTEVRTDVNFFASTVVIRVRYSLIITLFEWHTGLKNVRWSMSLVRMFFFYMLDEDTFDVWNLNEWADITLGVWKLIPIILIDKATSISFSVGPKMFLELRNGTIVLWAFRTFVVRESTTEILDNCKTWD